MIEVIAFKDWAAVCDAMGQGRQSIILRKGGLAEGRDGFQFKHPEFFLFPTGYHEQFEKLRAGLADGLHGAGEVGAGHVQIRDFFRLEWHATVTDWSTARALEPFHLYLEEVVRERFDYDESPGLQVAFGRAYRLAQPWVFPDQASFGGCRSWIKLPTAPEFASTTPALGDIQHAERAEALDEWQRKFGVSASRFAAERSPLMRLVVLVLAMMTAAAARAAGVPSDCRQLLVAIAPDWNSQTGILQRYERDGAGAAWRAIGTPLPVLFGREGLAWGSGVEGQNEPGRKKTEKDRRVPAGVFAIGKIYTSDATLPAGADYPFHHVTDADVWPDDPNNPSYNRHAVYADPASRPAWFQKQKMKPHDPVYRWLIEIRHNSDPIVAGAGSAIFFHIRRGPTKPSSGCTTMREQDIADIVRWLRAPARPHYAVMPAAEYAARQKAWNLPPAK